MKIKKWKMVNGLEFRTFKLKEINDKGIPKSKLIKKSGINKISFDHAPPLPILLDFAVKSKHDYMSIRSTSVYVHSISNGFISTCDEIQEELSQYYKNAKRIE